MASIDNVKLAIQRELTEVLYHNLSVGLIGIFILSSVLVLQIHHYININLLTLWYSGLTLTLISGILVSAWYQRTKHNITLHPSHYYAYISGSTLTAVFIGLMASALMPANIVYQLVVSIFVMSIVGGAVQSLYASYLASAGYLAAAIGPLLGWQVLQIIRGQDLFIGIFIATLSILLYLIIEVHGSHTTLVNNIKLKIDNIHVTEELRLQKSRMEFLSKHDMLTSLYNRRYLEEIFTSLMVDAKKSHTKLSVFMFDIDYFKTYNDELGHEAGDIILRRLGKFIEEFFAEPNLAFRYGGEEFLIVLQNMPSEQAAQYANDFREAVKRIHVLIEEQKISIHISGGIATYPDDGTTARGIINAADRALYQAKNAGRDQICLANWFASKRQ